MTLSQEMQIRLATPSDSDAICDVLQEAAGWLEQRGTPLWPSNMFDGISIAAEMSEHAYYVVESVDGHIIGTFRFQHSDPDFWPDVPANDSAFIHRVAIRRHYAGCGLSKMMLDHAKEIARKTSLSFLRLDCAADRPKLRYVYEQNGFTWHSDRMVGSFNAALYEWRVQEI
jgi:GNAT superfamily N-acetyltransferase